MQPHRLSPRMAIITGLAVTAAAVVWFAMAAAEPPLAIWMVCPGAAFTAMLLLGSDSVIERMRTWVRKRPLRIAFVPSALWTIYLVYAAGMRIVTPFAMLVMAVYLLLPFVVFSKWHRAEPLVILWIWLPLEFGIIRKILVAHTIGPDLHYALAQLIAIDAGIAAFVIWNRTPNVGYRFEYQRTFVVV